MPNVDIQVCVGSDSVQDLNFKAILLLLAVGLSSMIANHHVH